MNLRATSESDPRARPKPSTFYPPRNNRLVIGIAKWTIERSLRRKLGVTEVEVKGNGLEALESLKGQRCLLTPSHSGGFEPHIILYLSKLLNADFNYVAAVELFEQNWLFRWIMPRMGAYSIIRGAVDRPSFSMTRQLLADGKRWLVIFPEGHTVWQNSMVIPFQQGVMQLAFKGYEDAKKEDSEAHLYCLPIAIRYVYLNHMDQEIQSSLSRLESKLSIECDSDDLGYYERLRRIGEAVLAANEKAQQIKPEESASLNDRIQYFKQYLVARLENQLEVTPAKRNTLLDRIRTLFNTLDRITYQDGDGSEYDRQLASERQQSAASLYDQLWRLLHFAAIYDGYVKESMTVERYLDILGLLDLEIFKKRQMRGPRKAIIQIGEPIDLKDRQADYSADKRSAVKDVTLELEDSVRNMLQELESECSLLGPV